MDPWTHAADLLEADEYASPKTPDWRGGLPWDRPYSELLASWQGEGRPPAFRDGRGRPEQLLPGSPGALGAVWGSTVPVGTAGRLVGSVGRSVVDDSWTYWLARCGRGWGKTDAGANAVIEWARAGLGPILIAGPTAQDVRDTMVEVGPSAIMNVAPPDFRPEYEPSKLRLTFPNGVYCVLRSGEEPDRFRGAQFLKAWFDELAAWKRLDEAWEQIRYVMRLKARTGGSGLSRRVQVMITTTPRAVPVIKALSRHPKAVLTVRSSYDNLSNLEDTFRELITEAEGTRLGQQEIYGDILEDVVGAMTKQAIIDASRIEVRDLPELQRIAVAVDPPGGATECGIVVGGFTRTCPLGDPHCKGHGYILEDATEGDEEAGDAPSPKRWAQAALDAHDRWMAGGIVAEVNYGGDMVKSTIETEAGRRSVKIRLVRATRGKLVRAEPVSALMEAGNEDNPGRPEHAKRAHPRLHIVGVLPKLEGEMTTYVAGKSQASPNRMDAAVWVVTDLMLTGAVPSLSAVALSQQKSSSWAS